MLLVTFSFGVQGQITVSINPTIWTTLPLGYEKGITINSGVQLTIGALTLNMNPGKSITLNSGAKLILNGTTIQCDISTNLWKGIIANGNGLEQFAIFPDPKIKSNKTAWEGSLNPNQTKVSITNCTIKNATIGIESTNGATIRSRDNSYINCEKGVFINTYRSVSKPKYNSSFFMSDQFLWNDLLDDITTINRNNLMGIQLNNVGVINIGGCTFQNTNNIHCLRARGIGISSVNSDFSVENNGSEFCALNPDCSADAAENCGDPITKSCLFDRLFNGIRAVSSSTRNDQIIIKYNSFENNFLGVFIERTNSSLLFQNNFTTDRSILDGLFNNIEGCSEDYYTTSIIRDIETNGARQLRIIENTLVGNNKNIEHILINASNGAGASTSLVKKNIFTALINTSYNFTDEVFGILLQGNNSSLELICNTFNDMGCDIFNTVSSTMTTSLLAPSTKHTSNTHSSSLSGRINLVNDGTWGGYTRKNGTTVSVGPLPSSIAGSTSSGDQNCNVLCTDFDNIIQNSGAGIQSLKNNYLVNIFPNPASLKIQLDITNFNEQKENLLIKIYSTNRKLVIHTPLNTGEIYIENLINGMYTVEISNKEQIILGYAKLAVLR